MSKATILKNGIPSFDASGSVSMIPKSTVEQPFGFKTIGISYTEEPRGNESIVLISDIGAYPLADGFGMHGFTGIVFKYNGGYLGNGFGMAIVNAAAGYSVNGSGPCLNTTHSLIMPMIVKYNGHVYIAIKVKGNSGTLSFYGRTFDMLPTPIILNNRNGLNVSDAQILVTGIVVGGKTLFHSALERRCAA